MYRIYTLLLTLFALTLSVPCFAQEKPKAPAKKGVTLKELEEQVERQHLKKHGIPSGMRALEHLVEAEKEMVGLVKLSLALAESHLEMELNSETLRRATKELFGAVERNLAHKVDGKKKAPKEKKAPRKESRDALELRRLLDSRRRAGRHALEGRIKQLRQSIEEREARLKTLQRALRLIKGGLRQHKLLPPEKKPKKEPLAPHPAPEKE